MVPRYFTRGFISPYQKSDWYIKKTGGVYTVLFRRPNRENNYYTQQRVHLLVGRIGKVYELYILSAHETRKKIYCTVGCRTWYTSTSTW
jgi:hypothetical protein